MKKVAYSFVLFLVIAISPQIAVAQSTQQTDLKTRIEERKQRLQTKVDAVTSQRLVARCTAAQAKLEAFGVKAVESNKQSTARYSEFISKVGALEENLAAKNIKSSELLGEVSTMKQKYEAYSSALNALTTSIDDAKSLDCKADPAAFKSAIDDARNQAATVVQTRTELRKYIIETVRPTLQTLKNSQGQ